MVYFGAAGIRRQLGEGLLPEGRELTLFTSGKAGHLGTDADHALDCGGRCGLRGLFSEQASEGTLDRIRVRIDEI